MGMEDINAIFFIKTMQLLFVLIKNIRNYLTLVKPLVLEDISS